MPQRSTISGRLAWLRKPRATAAGGALADIRRHYDEIAGRYGAVPGDIVVERAVLGQIKGEWVRVAETKPERLIVYLHGGGFVAGSPEAHRALLARLCKSSAAAGLALQYRLGPEYPFPAGLRDVVDAYRHLIAKGFSPKSIVFAGEGAGGGLALSGLLAIRNAGLPMPAACVAMSPWADLTLSGWSVLNNASSDDVLSWELLFASARHYLQRANAWDPFASPLYGSFRDFPPLMVHAGSKEILRDDASRIGDMATAANVSISVEIYDAMPHVFQAHSALAEAKVSLNRLGQFIRARTPDAVPPDTAANSGSTKT